MDQKIKNYINNDHIKFANERFPIRKYHAIQVQNCYTDDDR